MILSVNYWGVVSAAVAGIVLGFLWYGPIFGKKWAELAGVDAGRMKPGGGSIFLTALGALVMSFALEYSIIFANTYLHAENSISSGITIAFLNWLGFIVPVTMGSVLWEGKSWKLWMLNALYYLTTLCLMGLILGM